MIHIPRLLALFTVTCVLGACSGAPSTAQQTFGPSQTTTTSGASTTTGPAATTAAALTTAPVAAAALTAAAEQVEVPTAPATPAPTMQAAPTQQPTLSPTTAPAATAAPTAPPMPTAAPAAAKSEVLFLRKGVLVALDPVTRAERTIADGVEDFTAVAGSAVIVLVRGSGIDAELWTVRRDGSALTQRTDNTSADVRPSLAPDGSAVVFASSSATEPYTEAWSEWGAWCSASQVRLIELSSGAESSLGQGCDPAFAPDGKRIAFATPPTGAEGQLSSSSNNTIRLVNRQGKNGWSFATATGSLEDGLVVYAPAWSPDSSQVVYHRFMGYQALVDIGLSEIAASFKGGGEPVYSGAGWQFPARFSPVGGMLAITENNYSDARGFGGYDSWSVTAITLNGTRTTQLPLGPLPLVGGKADTLARAQGGAWAPDGKALAVILPPGWEPDLPQNEPINNGAESPGELWIWQPGAEPQERLATGIDFASPVIWLF